MDIARVFLAFIWLINSFSYLKMLVLCIGAFVCLRGVESNQDAICHLVTWKQCRPDMIFHLLCSGCQSLWWRLWQATRLWIHCLWIGSHCDRSSCGQGQCQLLHVSVQNRIRPHVLLLAVWHHCSQLCSRKSQANFDAIKHDQGFSQVSTSDSSTSHQRDIGWWDAEVDPDTPRCRISFDLPPGRHKSWSPEVSLHVSHQKHDEPVHFMSIFLCFADSLKIWAKH